MLLEFSMLFAAGLQDHLDQITTVRQSLRTLLHTVSTYHATYVGENYTCTRRAVLFEQRISRLLSLILSWFFTAAEDNVDD
jgi:hypothetical protein